MSNLGTNNFIWVNHGKNNILLLGNAFICVQDSNVSCILKYDWLVFNVNYTVFQLYHGVVY